MGEDETRPRSGKDKGKEGRVKRTRRVNHSSNRDGLAHRVSCGNTVLVFVCVWVRMHDS